MRTSLLLLALLASFQSSASMTSSDFNRDCVENETAMQGVARAETALPSIQPAAFRDDVCHRAQLGPEDMAQIRSAQPAGHAPLWVQGVPAHRGQCDVVAESQMASVRPSADAPRQVVSAAGCHRGQLSREDLSFVVSVQPAWMHAEAGAPAADDCTSD